MKPLCTGDIAVKALGPQGEAGVIRCKRWSCPVCAEINRRKVIAFGKRGQPTAMLTLTVSSKAYDTPHEAAQDLKRALVALRKRIARAFPGETMPFLAVFERHESGFPHLHLLIRARFLPVKRLREMWEGITKHSWNVNIMALRTVGQVAYAAKYIGKDLAPFEHCKRWWRSHAYDMPQPDDEQRKRDRGQWERYTADIGLLTSALRALGCTIERPEAERITWQSPPGRTVTVGDAFGVVSAYWPNRAAARCFSGRRS